MGVSEVVLEEVMFVYTISRMQAQSVGQVIYLKTGLREP